MNIESLLTFSILGMFLCGSLTVMGADALIYFLAPEDTTSLQSYTRQECERIFRERFNTILVPSPQQGSSKMVHTVVIGAATSNPTIAKLIESGFIEAESHEQGYSMKCGPNPKNSSEWLLVIAGVDDAGVLYGLRDLEHFEMKNFKVVDGNIDVSPFSRMDYPRIEYRGHWVWGCNMPDKKAWLENMSQWKMNELIHWDNFPPKKAKEYVDFAHSRGIRVVWGFGWGWNPDWNFTVPKEFDRGVGKDVLMCGSDAFNKAFFKREILRKIRDEYAPSGCDGIYFQSFTETPKCECERCKKKSMGEIMLEFVNPLVDAVKTEFPDLWVSCGVHSNFGKYDHLKDLDPRCNLYWENCPSGTSIRGELEDFGYINKSLPYSHGFSETCVSDPEYTEASLKKWMDENAHRYTLKGNLQAYIEYMKPLQAWAKVMLGKKSANKHGTTVACHSMFSRRTPFIHVALSEAMWNPESDTGKTVSELVSFLKDNGGVPAFSEKASIPSREVQHDAVGKNVSLANAFHPNYPGDGSKTLTDGKRALEKNVCDTAWLGFHRQNLDAVIDLSTPTSINAFSTGFLYQPSVAVYLPEFVEYAVSHDGRNFKVVGVVQAPEHDGSDNRHVYRLGGLDLYKVCLVRVRANYVKEWLFVDEILVNPLQLD